MLRIINETTPWTHRTDEELLLEYRSAGNRKAFEEIVHRYERELHHYLYRYLGHSAHADDVVQKTFLTVLEKCSTFDTDRKLRPWLYTIATNKAKDHLRKSKRSAAINIDATRGNNAYTIANTVEGNEPQPFEEPMNREIARKVREAVERLPEQMKQAVYMVYFQGLSCREAADVVGIHYVTLSQRVKRAVKKLNFLLKNVG